jgi:hypothetical protein
MKKLFIVAVVLLTFTLSADWSEADKNGFMEGCMTNGALYTVCKCSLDFLQKRRTNVSQVNMQDIQDAIKTCTGAK